MTDVSPPSKFPNNRSDIPPPIYPTKRVLRRNIHYPHRHDVLSGRGGGTNAHTGNQQWRELIDLSRDQYHSLGDRRNKQILVRSIIWAIHNQVPPGRFLKRDETQNVWHEMSDSAAYHKTIQRIRETKRSLLRDNPHLQIPPPPPPSVPTPAALMVPPKVPSSAAIGMIPSPPSIVVASLAPPPKVAKKKNKTPPLLQETRRLPLVLATPTFLDATTATGGYNHTNQKKKNATK